MESAAEIPESYAGDCKIEPISSDNDKKFAKGLCKIEIQLPGRKETGTGFLCEFQCGSNRDLMGMFTNNHVLNSRQKYTMTREAYCKEITNDQIELFWTRQEIDVTFVSFKKEFAKDEWHYFKVSDEQIVRDLDVTILQYPEERDASVSRGKVTDCTDNTLSHTASTLRGSSGSPMLDNSYGVFGIHRKGGLYENSKDHGPHNIGTPIKCAIECMSKEIYSWRGLPLVPMAFGEGRFVDWNNRNSEFGYQSRWAQLVGEADKDARLHFQQLSLPFPDGSLTVLELFLSRADTKINVYGEHYEYADDKGLPLSVSLKMTLVLSNTDGEQSTRTIQRYVSMTRQVNGRGNLLFAFKDIDWNNLSSTTAPRAEVSFSIKETHSFCGLQLVPMAFGVKHSVDWNTLKSKYDYQRRWNEMVREEEKDQWLDVPPFSLSLPDEPSRILVLVLKRKHYNINVQGKLRKFGKEEILPLSVSLEMALVLLNQDGEQSTRVIQQNVKITDDRKWHRLFVFKDINWDNLLSTTAPSAEISFSKSHAKETYSFCGLSLVPTGFGVKHSVDWNTLKSQLDYQRRWNEMVREAEKDKWLDVPPFSLTLPDGSSRILVLILKREDDKINVHGRQRKFGDEKILPLPVSVEMRLFFSKENENENLSTRLIQQNVSIKGDRDWNSLFTFKDINWDNMSATTAPRAEVSLSKGHQKERYSFCGLSLMPMDFGVKHTVDWNTLKSRYDYQCRWNGMVREADSDKWLDVPPFSLSLPDGSSSILVLVLKREDDKINVYGRLDKYGDEKILPLSVSLEMTLVLSKEDGEQPPRLMKQDVSIKDDREWYPLFSFEDINWDNLSSTKAPRAELLFLRI